MRASALPIHSSSGKLNTTTTARLVSFFASYPKSIPATDFTGFFEIISSNYLKGELFLQLHRLLLI